MAGEFVIRNDLAGPNDSYVPMLVVDEPFQWTFPFKFLVDDVVRREGWFRHPLMTKPVICSISDFDALVGSCECGDDMATVLRAYLASDRMDPLDITLYDRTVILGLLTVVAAFVARG